MSKAILWNEVFKIKYPVLGASEGVLTQSLGVLSAPLSTDELAAIAKSQSNPFPPGDPLYSQYRPFDARLWTIPQRPLPPDYLDFLRWSNGGSFFNDDRHFDPFLACHDLRQYLIIYHIPQYMPDSIPFSLSGSGHVYLFDMRKSPKKGEYPILFASLGSLRYEQSTQVGSSFLEVCSGVTNPQDAL